MSKFISDYTLLLRKDALLESRGAGILIPLICYVMFVAVLISLGVELSQVSLEVKEKMFPALLWLGFFISSVSVLERGAIFEREYDGVSGLIVCGKVSPAAFFLSKTSVHFVILSFGFFALYLMASALLGVPIRARLDLCGIAAQGVLGFSLICTLFSFVTVTSKMRGTLLGLILIPLLFPLYLTVVELFSQIYAAGEFNGDPTWLSLLIALDAIYFVAGINLFESVVKE